MVTTGNLVHRQAISASSGQNELGKKPSVLTNFCFRSISSDTLVPGSPWSPQVTRHTGRLSLLSVVEMSWGGKFIVFGGNGCCGGVEKVE